MRHIILVRQRHDAKPEPEINREEAAERIKKLPGVEKVYTLQTHTSNGAEYDQSKFPQGDNWDLVVISEPGEFRLDYNIEHKILNEVPCDWTKGFSANLI